MKKTIRLLLVLMLLTSLFLSNGMVALAAENTEPEPEEQEPLGGPLPQDVGFNLRNVFVSRVPDSNSFTITALHVRMFDPHTGMQMKYGIAAYNTSTGKAVDIPGIVGWYLADPYYRVTFKNISETAIVLTAAPREKTIVTPAVYFNNTGIETRGVPFVLPTANVYNLMEPVDASKVKRAGNSVTISGTSTDREYSLFDSHAGNLISRWIKGTGGELTITTQTTLPSTAVAVTRKSPESGTFIKPDIPPVEPGADPAFTKTGFDSQTAMATLTIEATPGLEYAIASGDDGHILSIEERMPWGITAQTENGLYVMADETNFYSTPAEGKTIRFRVPPGGKYYVVTRLPDGSTSRPSAPYQTEAVHGNAWFNIEYDRAKKIYYKLYTIFPASIYSEYALCNTATGYITDYYRVKNNQVTIRIDTVTSTVKVVARPIPLPVAGETPSPGMGSPGTQLFPPLLNKQLHGFGATLDGRTIEVDPFDGFGDGNIAVESALTSEVGGELDVSAYSGAAVGAVILGVNESEFPLVILYDGEGIPKLGLYCYDGFWYSTGPVDFYGPDYTVYFHDGLEGDVLIYDGVS